MGKKNDILLKCSERVGGLKNQNQPSTKSGNIKGRWQPLLIFFYLQSHDVQSGMMLVLMSAVNCENSQLPAQTDFHVFR